MIKRVKNELGLTSSQAQELLKKHGFNELPNKKSFSTLKALGNQFKSLLVLLLFLAALLSFFLGDNFDGLLILAILILNASLGFFQEFKASREIEALKKMESPQTRVLRDGVEVKIPSKELVPQDIIILEAGDKISADSIILESVGLQVNEAVLTGESVPVFKTSKEGENSLFLGTIVISGKARAKVVKTGIETKFGAIALNLETLEEPPTPLEKRLADLAKKTGLVAVVVASLLFLIRFLQGFPLTETFFTSVALMVAAVPEGLPAIITIVLAIGARRMYHKKALLRRMSAIESLGAATVICTDKTGTLTKNEMRVKEVFEYGKHQEQTILKAGVICNSASLVLKEDHGSFDILGDTTDGAFLLWAKEKGLDIDEIKSEGKIIEELPFSLENRMMSVLWENNGLHIYTKGAPETVLPLCDLSKKDLESLTKKYEQMAAKGLRVLAVTEKKLIKKEAISKELKNLTFLGFVGIADAARAEAKEAVLKAQRAGIRVVMVTGDNELTAKAIGEEVGILKEGDEVLTGFQLRELTEEEFLQKIQKTKIFARILPEQKLQIVQGYQKLGETVAVTGDGVNDSLALKQAEVGVAMGITGSDVAKEASDVIILDDNFATIVDAVEQGRLIYDNILKVVRFLLAGNFSEILLIGLAVILGLPTPLLPAQILWINFVTDGLPALSLAADPASKHLMNQKPITSTLLSFTNLKIIVFGGVLIGLATLACFYIGNILWGEQVARNITFTTMVILQMGLVFILRGPHILFKNPYLLLSVIGVLGIQMGILFLEPLQVLFKVH